MNNLSIVVENLHLVIDYYDKIKIYRADSEAGPWNTELTVESTRIDIIAEKRVYYYQDDTGSSTHWYKTSYYNSTTSSESELSSARLGGTEEEKIGYSFDNYSPPSDLWGKILTADDIRYTYLFGIDCIGSDTAKSEFTDEQFDFFVKAAMSDFETFLTCDIRKRVYKTNPESALVQSRVWREGVDYTDEEDKYEWDAIQWHNYGFIQLKHVPVISIERCIWKSVVQGEIMDMIESGWIRLIKKAGQINLFPTGGMPYGPYSVYGPFWSRMSGGRYPGAFEIDYTTGFKSSDFVPEGLREVIGMYATIKALSVVGDGLLAGFSSQSVSLDGLSESFSSTQSATSIKGDSQLFGYSTIEAMYLKGKWHGKEILSINRKTGKLELKRILDVLRHDCSKKKSYIIKTEKGNGITITEDHSLFTLNMKEIKGSDIRVGTILLCKGYKDKVSNIIETKVNWMYDLSVEDNENFIANDFIVHNSAYFGARIKSYSDHITDWLKKNRYKFGGIPISFVGS